MEEERMHWIGKDSIDYASEREAREVYLWNVTFASDHFWIGATVPGISHQMAENVARDQIHQESGMQWATVQSLRLEEIEYLGIADPPKETA